jgi:hypothetical protein
MTMNIQIPVAECASAERVPIEVIHRQAGVLTQAPLMPELLNSVLNVVFVLNEQRQIVFAGRNFAELSEIKDLNNLLGLRPGEAIGCVHAHESADGCGATAFCQQCGAAQAILASLAGQSSVQEFRVTRLIKCVPEAMDLLVYATPFSYKGERFAILAVADINNEKRRRGLGNYSV